MNRAFSMLLTVALVGSLMFMGFAGTAAAGVADNGDEQSNTAGVSQSQTVTQEATSSSDGSFAVAVGDDAEANTGSSVTQDTTNTQNTTVEQTNTNFEDLFVLGVGT
ncbi:hypothetical protein [Natronolimnohabitans innermongolicus]|uniref:Uncharacterized protein n=1 Tax=Natronolimnohabitans innermongolicus JCM 12255 TaxID=1227499 RepID=L9X7N7_9EURY|nr:hypothetical protein [Natronolimnohabitans innermongolicus]ELY57607.1 hypothetical protein C493_08996 [Natronolimnohabitans innermongolicus JCM 12255]